MSANEHIEELLSGFLDGELTAEELREFELAMSADATLGLKVAQLRELGNELRSLPKRTLGTNFADRVLAAARQEALASDSPDIQHVRSGLARSVGPHKSIPWRAIGALAALAASLLFIAYVSNWFSPQLFSPQQFESLANIPSVEPRLDPVGSSETENQNESFVRNDPNLRKRISDPSGFAVLTIFEIEPSLSAWNENEVAKILSENGIVWTNPVNVSDEVIDVLNETRSINQGLPKSDAEPIALVMVLANGHRMDKALNRILNDVNAFPHVVMDMAFDLPGKELCKKLVDAQVSIANGQQAIATPIVVGSVAAGDAAKGSLESVSQFSGAPPAQYLTSSLRQTQQFGTEISAEEEDAISHVLLVIRKPTK